MDETMFQVLAECSPREQEKALGEFIFNYLAQYIHQDQEERIKNFIEKNSIDVNSLIGPEGMLLLHYAAQLGKLNTLAMLIHKHAAINPRDATQKTPLHHAMFCYNNLKVVHALINNNADIEVMDAKGRTPLHFAVYRNDIDLVNVLLDRGADIDALDVEGKTPTDYLLKAVQASLIKIDIFKNLTTFINSIYSLQFMLPLLLERGAFFTFEGLKKLTLPLHIIVMVAGLCPKEISIIKGKKLILFEPKSVIAALIKNGININQCDGEGRTALHYAVLFRCASIVNNLLKIGFSPNVYDDFGCVPFDYMATKGYTEDFTTLEVAQKDLSSSPSCSSF